MIDTSTPHFSLLGTWAYSFKKQSKLHETLFIIHFQQDSFIYGQFVS